MKSLSLWLLLAIVAKNLEDMKMSSVRVTLKFRWLRT